jgi:hypothetical protein
MCHYAQLTFPVPAVIVVTLSPPDIEEVDPVNPAPIVIVKESEYLNITTPEPPVPEVKKALEVLYKTPPPPPPVLAVPEPGAARALEQPPSPPPAEAALGLRKSVPAPPPPPPRATELPVIVEVIPAPPAPPRSDAVV